MRNVYPRIPSRVPQTLKAWVTLTNKRQECQRSQPPNLVGMYGNRTHSGRLNSAPQTVLKTAGPASVNVRRRLLMIGFQVRQSVDVRRRLLSSAVLAVILAVIPLRLGVPQRLDWRSLARNGPVFGGPDTAIIGCSGSAEMKTASTGGMHKERRRLRK